MKTHMRWTEHEINLLQEHGGTMLLHELCVLLPNHTSIGIKKKRTSLGIKLSEDYLIRKNNHSRSFINLDNLCKIDQSINICDIEDITLQILFGSILGDGSIKKTGKKTTRNFIFFELHRRPQFEYTEWKAKMLSIFFAKTSRSEENNYCQLWTASHPIFTMLRDKFYPSRLNCDKTYLPLDVLNLCNEISLLVWYLDDGYLGVPKNSNRCPQPHITAKGWDLQKLKTFIEFLNKKLDLSMKVNIYEHKGKIGMDKRVCINREDTIKLFPIWQKIAKDLLLPDCMFYKLRFQERNQNDK